MKTVNEVSKLTGVSVRTLHHYDAIGLLKPASVTPAGYRLYDTAQLERLQDILLFRELDFKLSEIAVILNSPGFDRQKALTQQIELLILKRNQLDSVIKLARNIQSKGNFIMSFKSFDKSQIEEYSKQAKAQWGETSAYKEYEQKNMSANDIQQNANGLMEIFAEIGALKDLEPKNAAVQAKIDELKAFITKNYYTCTNVILASLGEIYNAGDSMTKSIDAAGGKGTAEFASEAIKIYCAQNG